MCQGGGVQAIADWTNRSRAFPRDNLSQRQAVSARVLGPGMYFGTVVFGSG